MSVEAVPGTAPVLSACKLADDRRSAVLRFFNPSDVLTDAALVLPRGPISAYSADLLERRGERLAASGGRMPIGIAPRKIATFELVLPERERTDD